MLLVKGLAVIGTDVNTGHVYAFDPDSGTARWKRPAGPGVYADIRGDENRVFAVTIQDTVLCLRPETGEQMWAYSDADSASRHENKASPALVDSFLVFVDSRRRLEALRASNGSVAWQLDLGSRVISGVAAAGRWAFVITADEKLHRVDVPLGLADRELQLPGASPWLARGPDQLLAVLNPGAGPDLVAVSTDLDSVLWNRASPGGERWSCLRPIGWHGWVIAGTDKGRICAFEAEDGRPAWEYQAQGVVKIFGSGQDELYAGTQDGRLFVFGADGISP